MEERESMKKLDSFMVNRRQAIAAAFGGAAALALAACGGSNTGASTNGDTASGEAGKIKVGLICLHDENSTYDLNFIKGFKETCEKMQIGSEGTDFLIKTGIPESNECYDAAAELADAGCKLIFADSFGHEDYMIQAAKEFPEVQFCHATGTKAHTENLDNYHNAFAAIYEGRYLAGVAAGLKLKEMIDEGKITADKAKMGYVGAFTYAEVISGYTSFYLGAKSIVPEVTMDVTFTGSWYDQALEQEGATKLINGGCVLISQHADSMGAPQACENAKVPNVSYNGSTIDSCPNTFIVSSRINWSPYYEDAIGAVTAGKAIDTDFVGTLATSSVELTEVNDNVAAKGTTEKLEEVRAQLEAGKVHVFDTSTFTVEVTDKKNANAKVDGDGHLTSYKADVDSDAKMEGDTEVVSDGYFHESEYRSAPYFDLQIDGIKLLDTNFG